MRHLTNQIWTVIRNVNVSHGWHMRRGQVAWNWSGTEHVNNIPRTIPAAKKRRPVKYEMQRTIARANINFVSLIIENCAPRRGIDGHSSADCVKLYSLFGQTRRLKLKCRDLFARSVISPEMCTWKSRDPITINRARPNERLNTINFPKNNSRRKSPSPLRATQYPGLKFWKCFLFVAKFQSEVPRRECCNAIDRSWNDDGDAFRKYAALSV